MVVKAQGLGYDDGTSRNHIFGNRKKILLMKKKLPSRPNPGREIDYFFERPKTTF